MASTGYNATPKAATRKSQQTKPGDKAKGTNKFRMIGFTNAPWGF